MLSRFLQRLLGPQTAGCCCPLLDIKVHAYFTASKSEEGHNLILKYQLQTEFKGLQLNTKQQDLRDNTS